MNWESSGRLLIGLGVFLVLLGALVLAGRDTGWLGKLPGDIRIEKPNFGFYFPVATCIVLSVVATLILWILSRFR